MNLTVLIPLRPSAVSFWLIAGILLGMLAWLRAQPDYVPSQFGEGRRNMSVSDTDF